MITSEEFRKQMFPRDYRLLINLTCNQEFIRCIGVSVQEVNDFVQKYGGLECEEVEQKEEEEAEKEEEQDEEQDGEQKVGR